MFFYENILRDFKKAKVRYVLVGGIAVNLHGALRSTADLDILVEMSDANLGKVVRILKQRGYRVKQPVDPAGLADKAVRADWIKNKHLKAFNFYHANNLQEVDLIIDSPVSYSAARKDAARIKVDDLTLPVVSLRHLIKMKSASARPVDKLDIAELKQIDKLRRIK